MFNQTTGCYSLAKLAYKIIITSPKTIQEVFKFYFAMLIKRTRTKKTGKQHRSSSTYDEVTS